MDEMLDVLDEKTGEKTGKTISKDEAHKTGVWHGAIHIIIVDNARKKTLLQKRCEKKKLYPNTWDIAVGGHITAGETDYITAQRELEEELGLNSSNYKLEFLERMTEQLENNGFVTKEYVSIYIVYADIDINTIHLQESEVSEIKWCTKSELNSFIEKNMIIPHEKEYEILNKILIN